MRVKSLHNTSTHITTSTSIAIKQLIKTQMTEITNIINKQRDFFNSNTTKDIGFRKTQLKKLYAILKSNEQLLDEAIYADFRKSSFENYTTELSIIYHEIKLALKNLNNWTRTQRVGTDIANLPGKSYIIPEPLGNTLVIGAWNYPYQLSILPAVSAIAAGNTVIIKPSELAKNTSAAMCKIINENFAEEILQVVEGGIEETTLLLKEKFDKIFYTGSSEVGKIIMRAAADHLCPVVLELGGKSPVFILKDANIHLAAKRIVWAKFLNGGQTCVAPDYLLVEKGLKDKLVTAIKKEIQSQYGSNIKESEAFVRIINKRHFNRLLSLLDKSKIILGGNTDIDDLFISPTLMGDISFNDKVMQEEIFGPILPIIEFEDFDWAIKMVKERPKPLALYVFSNNTKRINKIHHEISFGSGAVNDAIMQLTNVNLPFGGVGYSGMGSYHGKYGFDTFSHYKSILKKTNLFEPSIKYAPFTSLKKKIISLMLE